MLRKIALALTLTMSATTAHAALIATDLHNSGDGLLTRDTATNLEWLDITQTFNKNGSDISSLTAANGPFAGFRWATAADFTRLYTDAGLVYSYGSGASATNATLIAKARALQDLLGYSNAFSNASVTNYLTGGLVSGDHQFGLIAVYDFADNTPDSYRAETYGVPSFDRADYAGVYLIRDVAGVPEPATWAMLIGGFGLVGGTMRRRKQGIRFA